MRFFLPWVLASLGVVAGCLGARHTPALLVLVAVLFAAISGVLAVAWEWRTSIGEGIVLVGVFALALARGLETEIARDRPLATAAGRGPARGLRSFDVVGASVPGPTCELVGTAVGSDATVLLLAPFEACPVAAGQRIAVLARELEPLREQPGMPRERERSATLGVEARLTTGRVWIEREGPVRPYWGWVARTRQDAWIRSRGDDAIALVAASVLGLRSALSPERRAELRASGLGHLVAVSGMNVGLSAWIVQSVVVRLVLWLRLGVAVGVVATWIPVLAYVGLTGAEASAVRAAAMHLLAGVGVILGRPTHGLHAVAVTAAVMLFVRPAWALDPGFQLSVVAMAAVVRTPASAGVLLQTWRVTWAVAPCSIVHFGDASPYGLVANLVAVPIFTLWVAPVGAVGWLLLPWLGTGAVAPAAWGATAILATARFVARFPPVPLVAIAGVAMLGLGVALVLACVRGSARLRDWVPAPVSAGATVLAIAWVLRPGPEPVGPWVAIGSVREATVIVIDDAGRACIRDPSGVPEVWPARLRALGVRAIVEITASEGREGPHLVALRHYLLAEGRVPRAEDRSTCVVPERAEVRQILTACARRNGGGSVAVTGARAGTGPRCFVAGEWVEIASHWLEDDRGEGA